MKILYVTTIGNTMVFFQEHVKMLISEGHSVEIACNIKEGHVPDFYNKLNVKVHHIPFSRSPISKDNILAYNKLKKLLQSEKYDVIHTHTPNASVCVRIAGRKFRKNGTKVLYTAHGFHFYKGAPLRNWVLYYPIERLCAHWTDILITINQEDYALAKKKMKSSNVKFVPGVGVDLKKFSKNPISSKAKKKELNIAQSDRVLLSVGELSVRKNHTVIIDALAELKRKGKLENIVYVICGEGKLREKLEEQITRENLQDTVFLLGRRTDINEICSIADVFLLPSLQEGLSVALMEAMACGLPCIVSDIRGNTDLIENNIGGYLCKPSDSEAFAIAIDKLLSNEEEGFLMGQNNYKKIQSYASDKVIEDMEKLYNEL